MQGAIGLTGDQTGNGSRPQSARERAFAQARRHSRRVRLLKRTLPALAVVIAVVFAGYTWLATPGKSGFDMEGAGFVDGKLVMESPRLTGVTREKRSYSMTADRAIQDFDNMDRIVLEGIEAQVPMNATSTAAIAAQTGVYDNANNTLDITSPVTIATSDGMTARLGGAVIDIAAGSLKTDATVDIEIDGSRITAQSLSVRDNGEVLVFENKVRMHLKPRNAAADAQAARE